MQNKADRPVTFVLFQENEILEEHSYSAVWHKGTVQKDEKVEIELPSDIYVSVNSAKPEDASKIGRGEEWKYDGQSLLKGSSDDENPTAAIVNESSSPVDVYVWKGNKKVFVQKQLDSKETFTVSISDKVFVSEAEKLNEGDEFQVLTLEQAPTAYVLEGDLIINATTGEGKIVFA